MQAFTDDEELVRDTTEAQLRRGKDVQVRLLVVSPLLAEWPGVCTYWQAKARVPAHLESRAMEQFSGGSDGPQTSACWAAGRRNACPRMSPSSLCSFAEMCGSPGMLVRGVV